MTTTTGRATAFGQHFAPGNLRLDGAGAGSGTDGVDNSTPPPTPPPVTKGAEKGRDLTKAIEGLIAKSGDPTAALRVLLAENYDYRDKLRAAESSRPPADARVLTGDAAKEYDAFASLGKAGDVKKAIEEGSTAKAELAGVRRAELHANAASIHGMKPEVVKQLAKDLSVEIRDVTGADGKPVVKDGKPAREAVVVTKDASGAEAKTTLDAYAKANWEPFMPALIGEAKAKLPGTPARTGTTIPKPGIEQPPRRPSLAR